MSIKSKKWYENQIKALENATNKLYREGERLSDIYLNDLPDLFAAQKPIKEQSYKLLNKLNILKYEYNLYYR